MEPGTTLALPDLDLFRPILPTLSDTVTTCIPGLGCFVRRICLTDDCRYPGGKNRLNEVNLTPATNYIYEKSDGCPGGTATVDLLLFGVVVRT